MLWLAALDQFVPHVLRRLETSRYESGGVFRFENSDLFALGPLVSYLREHPQGDRRRIVFLGHSVIFGYGLPAAEAVPAQYQRRQPGTRVFNAAFNGAELGSNYLIAKAVIDAVDGVFVLVGSSGHAHRMLPSLIPIEESDLRAFALEPPDSFERRLQSLASRFRLYASRHRLQAALFSTSTRQYIYLHKRDIARRLVSPFGSPPPSPPPPESAPAPEPGAVGEVSLRAPAATTPTDADTERRLGQEHPLLCRFAELARSHRKRLVLMQMTGIGVELDDTEVADFNAVFAPFAEIVVLSVPTSLRYDTQHLTGQGARAFADALARHEDERAGERK